MPKHVEGLTYDCMYCCIEILCSCWNEYCTVILMHRTRII